MTNKHDEWDYEDAELHTGLTSPTAVYSIRFPKAEITAIRAAARVAGVTTSEFIRRAAREKASARL